MTAFIANGRFYDFSTTGVNRLYRASTNTQYVDSAGNDDYTGDVNAPVATLEEAVNRVPKNYSGVYVIQLVGSGPWSLPRMFPVASPGGQIYIIGDRSSPVASNASPSFSAIGSKKSQVQDTSFGGPGTTEGINWLYQDTTVLNNNLSAYQGFATLTTAAGEVAIANSFGYSGIPAEIHTFSSQLICQVEHNVQSVQILGCILSPDSQRFEIREGVTSGCRIDVNFEVRFVNSSAGGVVNQTGSGFVNLVGGDTSSLIYRAGSGGISAIEGRCLISSTISNRPVTIRDGTSVLVNSIDFEDGGGFEYGSNINLTVADGYFENADFIFTPDADSSTQRPIRTTISVGSSTLDGNVTGDAVELIRGTGLTAPNNAFDNFVVGGNEVVVDGSSVSFNTDVFSLDTGSFIKYGS